MSVETSIETLVGMDKGALISTGQGRKKKRDGESSMHAG